MQELTLFVGSLSATSVDAINQHRCPTDCNKRGANTRIKAYKRRCIMPENFRWKRNAVPRWHGEIGAGGQIHRELVRKLVTIHAESESLGRVIRIRTKHHTSRPDNSRMQIDNRMKSATRRAIESTSIFRLQRRTLDKGPLIFSRARWNARTETRSNNERFTSDRSKHPTIKCINAANRCAWNRAT